MLTDELRYASDTHRLTQSSQHAWDKDIIVIGAILRIRKLSLGTITSLVQGRQVAAE